MKHRTESPMVGAGNRLAYEPTSQPTPMTMYPSNAPIRALTDSKPERDADLAGLMSKCARYMLDHGHELTPKQKQLLRDVEKGRYQFKVLSQLLEIAPTVNGGGNPLALSDALKAATMLRLPAPSGCLASVTIDETIAQGNLDPWQNRLLDEKTATIRDAALDRSGLHLIRLQQYHDFLLRYNPTSKRYFV